MFLFNIHLTLRCSFNCHTPSLHPQQILWNFSEERYSSTIFHLHTVKLSKYKSYYTTYYILYSTITELDNSPSFSADWLSHRPDWLIFCHMIISYKFTRFFYLFSVYLWRMANARNVRLYCTYWQYTDLFIFQFYISAYVAHFVYLIVVYVRLLSDCCPTVVKRWALTIRG